MEPNKLSTSVPSNLILILMFLTVTLANYGLYIGFALKPYMIFLFVFIMFHLSSLYFQRVHLFEIIMGMFYIMYVFSGAFALYPGSSFRIMVGIIIYLTCYFIMKSIILHFSSKQVEKSLSYAGIIFNLASLVLYIFGLNKFGFTFQGERIVELGVMVDRTYPRLIGLLEDPNFFVFYNTIFFAYFLCNTHGLRNKVGLGLCIITSLLTFSRGGLLALFIILLIYLLMNNPVKQVKMLFSLIASTSILFYITVFHLNLNIWGMIDARFEDFSTDGGSGRFELWERAWEFFNSSIVVGIGAFNFSDYNEFYFNDDLSVHNTFLDILSESGLLGILPFTLFVVVVFVQMFQYQVYRKKPYLLLTFIGYVLQMLSLSVIINDMFFMYLAILSVYLHKERLKEKELLFNTKKGAGTSPVSPQQINHASG
ncbi:O-antigen ligase family protein [Thalassorhabdus alkalitolerans]|uniref:O-antigen ligase family protein n=1 Tax=Thalassorhabdus alkalitolerans TaxID=2282697 RepID=A0ABW0YLR1_9BACI